MLRLVLVSVVAVVTVAMMAACSGDSSGGGEADAAPEVIDGGGTPDALTSVGKIRVFWNLDHGMHECESVGAATVDVTMTRQSDGLSVSASLPCADKMGVLPVVPREGIYTVHGDLVKDDGTIMDSAEVEMQFDTCDSIIMAGGVTLCGRELAVWQFSS